MCTSLLASWLSTPASVPFNARCFHADYADLRPTFTAQIGQHAHLQHEQIAAILCPSQIWHHLACAHLMFKTVMSLACAWWRLPKHLRLNAQVKEQSARERQLLADAEGAREAARKAVAEAKATQPRMSGIRENGAPALRMLHPQPCPITLPAACPCILPAAHLCL